MSGAARVLVTGASGLAGAGLLPILAENGFNIRTLTRRGIAAAGDHWRGDIGGALPEGLFGGVDAVVHLIAAVPGDDVKIYHNINVLAAARLAGAARDAGVSRFILLSSTRAMAGANGPRSLTEEMAPTPSDPYGLSKREGEVAVLQAFPGATILRPPLILGPGLRGAMGRLVALARRPIPLPFSGLGATRSYVTATGLGTAMTHCLRHPETAGMTALVASPPDISMADFLVAIRQAIGIPSLSFPFPPALVGLAARLALNADAEAALVAPVRVLPTRLAATGLAMPHDLPQTLAALARGLGPNETNP